jgi:hypothetical protein
MPVYTLSQNEDGASVHIDGVEVGAFFNQSPWPLFSVPLRTRPLSDSIFPGGKAKLQRARKHLAELVSVIAEYMKTQPLRAKEVGDSLIAFVESQVPQEINVVLGDVVHNLRASIDLLVCDLIRANGCQVTRDSAFPIATKGIQGPHLKKQLAGMSPLAVNVLSRITHNQSWNEALLLLHGLDIMDKHNSLVAVAAATVRVHTRVGIPGLFTGPSGELLIGGAGPSGTPFLLDAGTPVGFTTIFLTEKETEVFRYLPDIPQEVAVFGDLVFGPGEKGAGAPILQTLDELSQVVERILVLCERRCF